MIDNWGEERMSPEESYTQEQIWKFWFEAVRLLYSNQMQFPLREEMETTLKSSFILTARFWVV